MKKKLTLKQLAESYTPPAEDFEFELPGGEKLKARPLRDASEIIALEKKAHQIIAVCNHRPPDAWKPYLPADPQIIRMAVFCEHCMLEPPMPFVESLQIAKEHGFFLLVIGSLLLNKLGIAVAEAEEHQIETLKNSSGATDIGAPS